MKKKLKLSARIKDYLIQSALLAFSVLLALVLNEWRQSIKTDNIVDRVKTSLHDEIIHNKKEMHRALDYHKVLVNELLTNNHKISSAPVKQMGIDFSASHEVLENELRTSFEQNNKEIPEIFRLLKISDDTYRIRIDDFTVTLKLKNDTITFYGVGNIQLKAANILNTTWQTAQATNTLMHLDYKVVSLFADIYREQEKYIGLVEKIIEMLYEGSDGVMSAMQDLRNIEHELIEKYDTMLELLDTGQ